MILHVLKKKKDYCKIVHVIIFFKSEHKAV